MSNPEANVSATIPTTEQRSGFKVDDRVFVRPNPSRCTTAWRVGRVSGVQSAQNMEIDGVPRHVADVRLVEDGESVANTDAEVDSVRRACKVSDFG